MPGRRLRTCPLCRSTAIRTTCTTELESGRLRLLLQCGECGAWRVHDVRPRTIRALARRRRRDLARMERLADRIELPDPTTAPPEGAER